MKTVNRQAIDIQILQAQIATIMTRIPRDAQEPPAKLELARPLARMADIASKVAAENMISSLICAAGTAKGLSRGRAKTPCG